MFLFIWLQHYTDQLCGFNKGNISQSQKNRVNEDRGSCLSVFFRKVLWAFNTVFETSKNLTF